MAQAQTSITVNPSSRDQQNVNSHPEALLSDALVVVPATVVVVGILFALVRDAGLGADIGQTLIAMVAVVSCVGFAFCLLKAIHRFKIECDDKETH